MKRWFKYTKLSVTVCHSVRKVQTTTYALPCKTVRYAMCTVRVTGGTHLTAQRHLKSDLLQVTTGFSENVIKIDQR